MKQVMILASMMVMGAASWAAAEGARGGKRPPIEKAKWAKMNDDEKREFHKERKAKWEKMSDSEKVKMLEEHRQKRMKKLDAQWKAMSDSEKVKYAEEKMKKPQGQGGKTRLGFQE